MDLEVNQYGFIGNGYPLETLKKDGKRIIMMGGSSLAGAYTTNDMTIPARVEKLTDHQVLNFGMGGQYIFGNLVKLLSQVLYMEPDIVICLDGFNDAWYLKTLGYVHGLNTPLINWADFSYFHFDQYNGFARKPFMFPPLAFTSIWIGKAYRYLDKNITIVINKRKTAVYQSLLDYHISKGVDLRKVFRNNLETMALILEARGIKGFFYLQPAPDSDLWPFYSLMSVVYEELDGKYEGVRFFDIQSLFHEYEMMNIEKTEYFVDQIHYTDLGNELISKRMAHDLGSL